MAVFLIYQPDGLLESTLFTLSYLADQGISTVVVSNAPLKPRDRACLLRHSHLVIERPNVGYDFGGYREGILTLLERGKPMQALYVLNDSMWFPLNKNCDTIERCRLAPADIFGLYISHLSKRSGDGHIQSYFFRFSEEIIRDPAFRNYWRGMRLIDHKHAVIRLYERGLSKYFARRGYKSDSLIHWRDLIDHVLGINDEDIMRELMEHQCRVSQKEAEQIMPALKIQPSTLQARDNLADDIARRKIFVTLLTAHPLLQAELKVPFLKKAKTEEMALQRSELRRLGLDRDFAPCIRREIEIWDATES